MTEGTEPASPGMRRHICAALHFAGIYWFWISGLLLLNLALWGAAELL